MEQPLLRMVLIVIGIAAFSLSAWSSPPARCWSGQTGDERKLCLAKVQLNDRYCEQLQDHALLSQCQAAAQAEI